VRLREDNETIVIRVPFDRREELMAGDPETYYITDHYDPYEYVLVRLGKVHPDAVRELLAASNREATRVKKRRAGRASLGCAGQRPAPELWPLTR
jgi:hypothetical protein